MDLGNIAEKSEKAVDAFLDLYKEVASVASAELDKVIAELREKAESASNLATPAATVTPIVPEPPVTSDTVEVAEGVNATPPENAVEVVADADGPQDGPDNSITTETDNSHA